MSNDHQPEIPLPPNDDTLTVPKALDLECQHNPAEPIYLFRTEENAQEPAFMSLGVLATGFYT